MPSMTIGIPQLEQLSKKIEYADYHTEYKRNVQTDRFVIDLIHCKHCTYTSNK